MQPTSAPGAPRPPDGLDALQEAPESPRRGRKPADPEKRAKAADARLRKRYIKRLEEAESEEELLDKAEELLEQKRGRVRAAPAEAPAQPQLEPGQKPGWPPPSQIAAMQEMAQGLWSAIGRALKGTRYELKPEEKEVVGEDGKVQTVTVDPEKVLADATAPVLAKHVPAEFTTPESMLALAVASILLPRAIEHLNAIAEKRHLEASRPKPPPVPDGGDLRKAA